MQRERGREGGRERSLSNAVRLGVARRKCHYLHQSCALQRAEAAAAAGAGRRGGGKGDVAVPCPACGLETWLRGGAAGHQVRRRLVRTRCTKYADVQNTKPERWEASAQLCMLNFTVMYNNRSILQRTFIIADYPGILRPDYLTV
jgi:hypothetical protein